MNTRIELLKLSSELMRLAGEDQYEETGMIKSNLSSIASKAQELHDMVKDSDNLEEWVQEKIAVCAEYMGVIHDHLKYSDGLSQKS